MRARILFTPLIALVIVSLASAGSPPKKRGKDYDEGKKIWQRSCWHCHGSHGIGDGPVAPNIAGGVPDLTPLMTQSDKRSALIRSVLVGKNNMPAFQEELKKADARRALIYIEKLQEREANKKKAPPQDETSTEENAQDEESPEKPSPADEKAPDEENTP